MASKRTYLRDVNPHLICPLCRGYLIDATTVVECLHSFCRSCILKHLRKNAQCPSCKHLLNTAKPNIKADKALQDIVYKLVPGLYHKEMRKRREFYSKHPEHGFAASLNRLAGADSATPEQRGEDVSGRLIFAPEDAISLSLEYLPVGADPQALLVSNNEVELNARPKINGGVANRRYLQCPALVTIAHLKKFLAMKYSVDVTRYNIDICHRCAPLPEHWTLMDVAYIFAWKRNAPIRFFYRITQEEQRLEAPPNDRPSTPGVGASQPVTSEQAAEPEEKQPKDVNAQPNEPSKPAVMNEKSSPKIESPKSEGNVKKPTELLAKRSAPPPKIDEAKSESEKQVKTPIKIMKNSDGRYQVLRPGAQEEQRPPQPQQQKVAAPAEFSVVSIGDSANSNGVKITLKQCSPGSGKPKVISNVLLKNSPQAEKASSIVEQVQDMHKQEKQKRKQVTFSDSQEPAAKQSTPRKPSEQLTDKKQFLQGFRLTVNKQSMPTKEASKEIQEVNNTSAKEQEGNPAKKQKLTVNKQSMPTKEASKEIQEVNNTSAKEQEGNPAKKQKLTVNKQSMPTLEASKEIQEVNNASAKEQEGNPAKKQKLSSTNIAERLSDAKQLSGGENNPPQVSSSQEQQQQQQPIDVYAFPNDPPTVVPAGAVKRKCPPGLPIFELKKKQQQYQAGKRAGVNSARGGAAVKCYRNQTKPMLYLKPPPSPARPSQNLPSPAGNVSNVNVNAPTPVPSSPTVSSTSPKTASPSVMISNDTRNMLDGCGLNIPASLSITLTAPKSPSRNGDSQLEIRGAKDNQSSLDKLNPTITLNDKSVDPRVLKALKAGQMRVPPTNAKAKGRPPPPMEQAQPAKRKKEEINTPQRQQQPQPQQQPLQPKPQQHQLQQQLQQQPRNILDLSATKKMDLHPLRIPTPPAKLKPKPPTWSQANSPKPPNKDDLANYPANGQVVTLAGGQRFYRAPPGSRTPAVHRMSDIPTPTRTPVYASCFSSPTPNNRSPQNLSSVFPSLQSLFALSQAPSLEQFHMDSRMRIAAAAAAVASASKEGNTGTNTVGGLPPGMQVTKSHLAAQCAPLKPARSSVGSFAVPLAKPPLPGLTIKPAVSTVERKSVDRTNPPTENENSARITDSNTAQQKSKTKENPKEAPTKADFEQNENCASSTEECSNSQQGSASPRVTSTASPSPPPAPTQLATESSSSSSNNNSKSTEPTTAKLTSPEVTSTNGNSKSPESPDSSSAVAESNPADSTKPNPPEIKTEPPSSKTAAEPKAADEAASENTKIDDKVDAAELKKAMSSEVLQKRFLAVFPSNEWPSNPIAAEQFGNFLRVLSSAQAEAQPKNAKAAE